MDGTSRGAWWAWTWKSVGETLFQRGLGVCICGAAAYRVLVQWCCVGPCLFGPGRVGLGTMLLNWVFCFPQWGLGVCIVLWSVGCKSIQFLVRSFKQNNPLYLFCVKFSCDLEHLQKKKIWWCSRLYGGPYLCKTFHEEEEEKEETALSYSQHGVSFFTF